MENETKSLKTIAVRKPGTVRLTRAAVYCYGCCCCARVTLTTRISRRDPVGSLRGGTPFPDVRTPRR